MDAEIGGDAYQQVCNELETWIDNPDKTLSAQLLEIVKTAGGLGKAGCALGMQYRQQNLEHQYQVYSKELMEEEVIRSAQEQLSIEQQDTLSFDEYLEQYFAYLK
jgi:glutamate--cysteine ligase